MNVKVYSILKGYLIREYPRIPGDNQIFLLITGEVLESQLRENLIPFFWHKPSSPEGPEVQTLFWLSYFLVSPLKTSPLATKKKKFSKGLTLGATYFVCSPIAKHTLRMYV